MCIPSNSLDVRFKIEYIIGIGLFVEILELHEHFVPQSILVFFMIQCQDTERTSCVTAPM